MIASGYSTTQWVRILFYATDSYSFIDSLWSSRLLCNIDFIFISRVAKKLTVTIRTEEPIEVGGNTNQISSSLCNPFPLPNPQLIRKPRRCKQIITLIMLLIECLSRFFSPLDNRAQDATPPSSLLFKERLDPAKFNLLPRPPSLRHLSVYRLSVTCPAWDRGDGGGSSRETGLLQKCRLERFSIKMERQQRPPRSRGLSRLNQGENNQLAILITRSPDALKRTCEGDGIASNGDLLQIELFQSYWPRALWPAYIPFITSRRSSDG